jgi:hypothetical protein
MQYNIIMAYLDGDGYPAERFLHNLASLPTLDQAKARYSNLPGAVVAIPVVLLDPDPNKELTTPELPSILVHINLCKDATEALEIYHLETLK